MFVNTNKKIAFFLLCCVIINVSNVTFALKKSKGIENCKQLPENVLRRVHGPAFDARYMSIDQPLDNEEFKTLDPIIVNRKRNIDTSRPSFYLTDNHTEVLFSDEPAWNIQWDTLQTQIINQTRRKRSLLPIGDEITELVMSSNNLNRSKRHIYENNMKNVKIEPWQCEQKITWIHLGLDYYPSHLKTVKCTESKCFYKMHDCMPRHFAVRILQRRRGACADTSNLKVYGFSGSKFAELWEWVEVAINFCCVCTAASKNK